MAIEKDFDKFSPSVYLNEYYMEIGDENSSLLDFFHKIYSNIEPVDTLLDFGGGPTIYQLISASSKVNKIIFSEFIEANRDEVTKWLNDEPGAFNWDPYFRYVLDLEGKEKNEANIEKIKERLKSKVEKVIKCDAYKERPLEPELYKDFDIVSVCFCPEGATDNEKDYVLFMKNITSLLKESGLLVMVLVKNAEFYDVGEMKFPAFPVDEKYIESLLGKLGYQDIKLETIGAEHEQGYEGMIFLTASKA